MNKIAAEADELQEHKFKNETHKVQVLQTELWNGFSIVAY